MTKTHTLPFAKVFAIFAILFLFTISSFADCSDRPTSAQPGSPFQYATTFRLGNNGSYGYFHDYQTHQDGTSYSACAVDMNVGSATADEGLAIIAVADGTVSSDHNTPGWFSGFGNTVIINHSSTTRSWYSHLAFDPSKKPGLKAGDSVRRGAVIGFLGGTGMADSPHLHFEWQELVNGDWKSMDFTTMDNQTVASGLQLTATMNNALIFDDTVLTYPDGTFVKDANSSTIYYVDGGQLRAFTNQEHFRSWFPYYTYNMPIGAALAIAGSYRIAAYAKGPDMSFRPGTLLRADTANDNIPNATYYQVYNDFGTIRKTPKTFNQIQTMGFEEGSAMVVPASLINSLPGGPSSPTELYSTSLYTDSSLVAYYRFEGSSNDSKGSNNGTDTSITYGTSYGKFGQGAGFNGSTSVVTFSNTPISSNGTISMWVNHNGTGNAEIIGGNTSGLALDLQVFAGKYYFRFETDSSWVISATNIITEAWSHVVVTWAGTTSRKIYVNGIDVTTGSPAFGTPNTAQYLYLGSRYDSPPKPNAYFDDLAIFSRALTATEVSGLYAGN